VYAFFVLQCTISGRWCKHKTDVTAWHGINFHKNNQWNILVIGNYYVNFQNYQNSMLFSFSDTKGIVMHLFLFTISPRENWFQYVRRVYATAINFPCIITLIETNYSEISPYALLISCFKESFSFRMCYYFYFFFIFKLNLS